MATSLKTRVIVREHSSSNTTWAGSYSLLIRATSIPSPIQAPNPIEKTTTEDSSQVFELGINQSGALDIEGNLDKDIYDAALELVGKECDIIQLYGTDGLGGVRKVAYQAQLAPRPNDTGVDEELGMVITAVPSSVPTDITDTYTVAESSGSFTVTAVSAGSGD